MTIVAAADLVPGDIMVLEEGDSISADARLIRQYEMSTNNIALTGESDPVRKTADPVIEEKLATIDMPNLVFMGTSVASGNGRAVVFATGMKTEFGRSSRSRQACRKRNLRSKREIAPWRAPCRSSRWSAALRCSSWRWRSSSAAGGGRRALLFALGVMVALVPEGLPATLSVALAVGVQRMAKENALIKKLAGVETLGSPT